MRRAGGTQGESSQGLLKARGGARLAYCCVLQRELEIDSHMHFGSLSYSESVKQSLPLIFCILNVVLHGSADICKCAFLHLHLIASTGRQICT